MERGDFTSACAVCAKPSAATAATTAPVARRASMMVRAGLAGPRFLPWCCTGFLPPGECRPSIGCGGRVLRFEDRQKRRPRENRVRELARATEAYPFGEG